MPLASVSDPFDDPDWFYEPKYDGFRALAYIDRKHCQLVSRRGHVFRSWVALANELPRAVRCHAAVLDDLSVGWIECEGTLSLTCRALRDRVTGYDPSGRLAVLRASEVRAIQLPGFPALDVIHKPGRWTCHSAIRGVAAHEVAFSLELARLSEPNNVLASEACGDPNADLVSDA
jgi:hypothetical protein